MSRRAHLTNSITEAMKARDQARLGILRQLLSAVQLAEIERARDLSDSEVEEVARRLIKQIKDANIDFLNGGRMDLVEKNNQEVVVLSEFVPAEMPEGELVDLIKTVMQKDGLTSAQDIGRLMGKVMREVNGRADGNRVRELATAILSGK